MRATRRAVGLAGLTAVCAAAAAVWMVGTAGRLPVPARWNGAPATRPETVQIPSGEATYRPFGSFSRDGKAATPAFQNTPVGAFEIMKYQVSRSEYAACVAEGACADAETGSGNMAQTNVNWIDATAYAAWFSDKTGESWRLPTAPEWFRAAAERQNDAAPDETDLDPGERMLSQYRRGVFLRGNSSPTLRPRGGFGQNSLGLADMGGNVWEWTDGCMENGEIDKDGRITLREPYCGVRIAGGRHQAGIVDFVRDARAGGCAAGLPPDYLGFRLVRDNS